MNLTQVLHKLESFTKQQKFVSQVTIGDVYENWNGHPDMKYGAVNFEIPQTTINDNMQQMQIYVYYADRLAHDHSNEYDIKTTAEEVLTNIVNYLAQIGDIYNGYVINFFTLKFADDLAGGYLYLTFETGRDLEGCLVDEYSEDPEITLEIVENGIYDVTVYKKVIVNVPSVTTEEITQEEYDELTEYDPYKIYLIKD